MTVFSRRVGPPSTSTGKESIPHSPQRSLLEYREYQAHPGIPWHPINFSVQLVERESDLPVPVDTIQIVFVDKVYYIGN